MPVTRESPYSIDRNLWGTSIECGELEDPWKEPPRDAYLMTRHPEDAPEKPTILEIEFEQGIPVALDGKPLRGVELALAARTSSRIALSESSRAKSMKRRGPRSFTLPTGHSKT